MFSSVLVVYLSVCLISCTFFFFFNDTATTEIYTVLTHSFPTRRSSDLMLADASDAEILQAESDEQIKVIRTPNQIEADGAYRSEEHTSELQSLMRISYAVFCLKKKKTTRHKRTPIITYITSAHTRNLMTQNKADTISSKNRYSSN